MRPLLPLVLFSTLLPPVLAAQPPVFPAEPPAAIATAPTAAALGWQADSFRGTGSVLYVAAHPDDENTQLITALARGRAVRTAYLSLTRGDGGQNESGPEFGEKLGLARTYELLAARRLDGGHQYFTRALDFGYSKTVDETLRFWNRQAVLSDVVRVIREFRPDVIITRFSPEGGGTHGHHTASAVLALEAFKLAGDPQAFPEQLKTLQPWQPKRVLQNMSPWNPKPTSIAGPVFKIEANGKDPVTGQSLAAVAAQSRAQHITQGFANFGAGAKPDESRPESLAVLAGDPASTDPLEGVDTSWRRYPQGEELQARVDAWAAAFDSANPAKSVGPLLELRKLLLQHPDHPDLARKRLDLEALLTASLGLQIKTQVAEAWVSPGDPVQVTHQVQLAQALPVVWVSVNAASFKVHHKVGQPLRAGTPLVRETKFKVPTGQELSQPYWLRAEPQGGLFQVTDETSIGRPINRPAVPVDYVFSLDGQEWTVRDEPQQTVADVSRAQTERPLEIAAPVTASFAEEVSLFSPGETRLISVQLTAHRPGLAGTLHLQGPSGWTATPQKMKFALAEGGQTGTYAFKVTAPATGGTVELGVQAEVAGRTYGVSRVVIRYSHLPALLLQPIATQKAVVVPVTTTAKKIGYLPGAGDATVEALKALGCDVTVLEGADLSPEKLAGLDAVVVGVRAFNERVDLKDNVNGLFAYAEQGGTVIVQYNRPNGLKTPTLAPFALSIQGDAPTQRVTDETAPVTFLAPTHQVLNAPNRITEADFAGWVQERGTYFPKTWDEQAFEPILAMNDAGEAPLRGSLLIARHGKGHFVYTGLTFFRQLPAGVPGAYRLFANLLSLGK